MGYAGILDRYGHLLDLPEHAQAVTLLEGNTLILLSSSTKPFGLMYVCEGMEKIHV